MRSSVLGPLLFQPSNAIRIGGGGAAPEARQTSGDHAGRVAASGIIHTGGEDGGEAQQERGQEEEGWAFTQQNITPNPKLRAGLSGF